MNTPNNPLSSQTVEQTNATPADEADEIPTVILDASFFRRRSPLTEGDAPQTKAPRTLTFSSR
ncbi:MAG: hypothetical protein B7Z37_24900 [Verrucomicrobia bacterium 12-59-8]|nr:MAG: hypothetical protein B7Z37_24900 [Verrucomicrobia bacterium 12-59-8]